jgi:hypothetical protein
MPNIGPKDGINIFKMASITWIEVLDDIWDIVKFKLNYLE